MTAKVGGDEPMTGERLWKDMLPVVARAGEAMQEQQRRTVARRVQASRRRVVHALAPAGADAGRYGPEGAGVRATFITMASVV